jgi:hypothetical protein
MTRDTRDYSAADCEALQRAHDSGINQHTTLGIKPWQSPPCELFYHTDAEIAAIIAAGPQQVGDKVEYECAVLAKRLIDAGLSLFEPDPEKALNTTGYRATIRARQKRFKSGALVLDPDIAKKRGMYLVE